MRAYRALLAIDEGEEVDVRELASRLRVSTSTARRYLRQLIDVGLVNAALGRFKLTPRGVKVRRALKRVVEVGLADEERSYVFTDPSTGTAIPLKVRSLDQLYAVAKYGLVRPEILLEHVRAGYLGSWVRDVLGDDYAAELIEEAAEGGVHELLKALERYLSIVRAVREVEASQAPVPGQEHAGSATRP